MTDARRGVAAAYTRRRYQILFFSLLVSLAVIPVLEFLGFDSQVVELFLGANLVAAVMAVDRGPLRRAAITVLVLALAARPGAAMLGQPVVSTGSMVFWGALALLAAARALIYALRGREVGGEQVYAALSTYLLSGFFFGLLYWVIDRAEPESIAIGGAAVAGGISVSEATYFSFVTLASLGYGDVLPVGDLARGLAVIEVVGGQLYLAAMVARLVGAWR